jgi:hypothetical protein
MFRFGVNRSWAFVLTLCLFTTCFSAVQPPSASSAGSPSSFIAGDLGVVDPQLGDPDVPTGPGEGKSGGLSIGASGPTRVVRYNQARPVGDGVVPSSVVSDRVRVFLLSLRSLYLRF